MINDLSEQIYNNAKSKGFHEGEKNIGEMLCLIHSEVSEALEADRKDKYAVVDDIKLGGLADKNYGTTYYDDLDFKRDFAASVKDTFEDELADVMIRVMDLAYHKGIDLERHIKAKMRYNAMREPKHGKKY